ncbi:MAG TPA: hypothetical protein VMH30_01425 [Verrucomicrobiae bacterium]|nr:hypothetical protein [Verrucomicrobiae bacterium]
MLNSGKKEIRRNRRRIVSDFNKAGVGRKEKGKAKNLLHFNSNPLHRHSLPSGS